MTASTISPSSQLLSLKNTGRSLTAAPVDLRTAIARVVGGVRCSSVGGELRAVAELDLGSIVAGRT
jgi:hypothetical protein